jgi:anti-anti-sigma factor
MPAAAPRPDAVLVTVDASFDHVRIDVVASDGAALLSPHGELDMFSVSALRAALEQAGTSPSVVVDLRDVPFTDTAILRCLAEAARDRARNGRALRLDNAQGIVLRLIDLMRLDDLRAA